MAVIEHELWTHFKPLWIDFNAVGDELLVAGGYGLFLKQLWLLDQEDSPIIIPLERWPDATPRVTKDLDLVIGLDLIANEETNAQLLEALEKHGFKVSERPQGKRWQFVKELGNDRRVLAELHAQAPTERVESLKTDRIRVKHKPSLGDDGVHGRLNPEAVGSNIKPFRFSIDATEVIVPNAVTWSVMKITAAHDRWLRSQDPEQDEEERRFSHAQAIKHGHDVCRTVAMMSIEERDSASVVIAAIKGTPQFQRASDIYHKFFADPENWANEVLADRWLPEDLEVIRSVLASWYNA